MRSRTIEFYTTLTGRCPTEEALADFESAGDEILEAMEEGLFELMSVESYSETMVVHVQDNLWYIRVRRGKKWAILFFIELTIDIILCLNGYLKKARKIPEVSRNQLRKAKYLMKEVKEVQHAWS